MWISTTIGKRQSPHKMVTLRTGSVDFNCIRNNLSLNGKAVTLRMGSVDFNPHEAQVWWVQQNRPSCEERGF